MKFPTKRGALLASILLLVPSGSLFGQAPDVKATKTDSFTPNGANRVEPGAAIRYQTTISNSGPGVANGLELNDAVPANTTLVPGSVNVSPLAGDDVYQAIVNTQLTTGSPVLLTGPRTTSAAKVTDNDSEYLGDAFTISAFDATSVNGGSVVMVTTGTSMGSFTYLPPAGFTGTDSFSYTLRDDGTDNTTDNADDLTGSGVVVINVVEADTVNAGTQKIWYVDNAYAGNNGTPNGTSARPFTALSAVNGATGPDAVGDTLHLGTGSGSYTGGITLLTDQKLIGANETLVLNSVTLATAGADPVITNSGGNGVTLASGNTLRGFTIGDTTTGDVVGTTVGTLTVGNVNCIGTGPIFTVSNSGALTVTLDTATATSNASTGISLTGCTGSFTATTGTITNVTGDDFLVSSGTAVITYGGTITNTAGHSVNIAGKSAGTVHFSGLVTDNTGSTGILLNANTGATINFTGGITANATTNSAFTATGGGTVNVSGANNSLTTTTATALNVANTTIGTSGLTFLSISANGATNGIILNNTGSSGGLTVTGNGNTAPGGDGSGGTIQNTTGAGILLTNTQNVSLTNMNVQGTADSGIDGTLVTNFTFDNSTISNSGTSAGAFMSNIDFNDDTASLVNQLSGTATITDSILTNAFHCGVDIQNFTGAISNLTISNNTLTSTTSTASSKAPGIRVLSFSGADITKATIDANTVTNFPSDSGIMVQGGNAVENAEPSNLGTPGSGTDIIAITNNIVSGQSAANRIGTQGILLTVNGTGNGNFNISGNSVSHTTGNSISHNVFGDAVVTSTINNNTILSNNSLGAQGIAGGTSFSTGFTTNTTSLRVTVSGNTISQTDGNGILLVSRDNATGILAAKIMNNTVAAPLAGVRPGIRVDAGNTQGDNDVFLEISGNTSAGSGATQGIGLRKQGTVTTTNSFAVRGMTATASPGIEAYINSQNPAASGTLLISATSGFSEWTGGGGQPSFQALLFARTLPDSPIQTFTPEASPAPQAPARLPLTTENPPTAAASSATTTDLTDELLAITTAEAIARWETSGLTPAQSAALRTLRVELVELDTVHLGQARGNLIQISRKPAGQEWFIDPSPADDSEFPHVTAATRRSATGGEGTALRKVDLLTTVMHEMGHTIGLTDRYQADARDHLMFGHLTLGGRRLPASGEARLAVPFLDETARFLGATINIGTLPPGKSVTIVGAVTVNDPANTQLISSQGTVIGSNFANVLTDDPAAGGVADVTTTPVERPDTTVATLTLSSTSPTNASSVTWRVVFSQAVGSLTASNFNLVNTGLGGSPTITSVTAVGGAPATTWNISATTGSGNGTLGLNLVNDTALSHDVTNQTFIGSVYTVDKEVPTVTSVNSTTPNAIYNIGASISVEVNFSASVTVTGTPQLILETGAIDRALNYTSGSGSSTLTFSYTVQAGDISADLDYFSTTALSLNGGTIRNSSLTAAILTLPGPGATNSLGANKALVIDGVRPTVGIVISDTNLTIGGTSLVTFTFSEAVNGFDNVDLTVANGTLTPVTSGDGGMTWTSTFTPTAGINDSTNVITLNLSGVTDMSGNTGSGSFSSGNYSINTIPPTITIAATTASATEGGTTGLYTFTRNGSTSAPLTIGFQLDASSTATAGIDFNLSSASTLVFDPGSGAGTVIIPSGSTLATVTLTALIETPNVAEAPESARLNIATNSNYTIGSPANATVSIRENGFVVTNTGDSGAGTLRLAIENANAIAGHNTITFDPAVFGTTARTISLASPLDQVRSPINLTGPGASLLTLRPLLPAAHWILIVDSTGELNLSGVTITGVDYERGGLTNYGKLAVTNCTITGNLAAYGGGIYNDTAGTLTVTESIISGNSAVNGAGGGIFNSGGVLTVVGSTIVGNSSSVGGGGICNHGGTATLSNSTIHGNSGAGGGGIYNERTGLLTVTNSTFQGNSAVFSGGGIANEDGTLVISSSTISGNSAMFGGGIISSVIPFTIANSIIAGNSGSFDNPDVLGELLSQGYNLLGNGKGATGTVGIDLVGTSTAPIDPRLGPLTNNGGPTQTMALLSNSPAINAGSTTSILTTDQRGIGFNRVIGTASDIGAFEQEKFVSILANAPSGNEGSSGNSNFTFTVSRIGGTSGIVDVTYTVSGAAVNAADFGGILPTGTATIPNGAANTTVSIPVSGDLLVEPNEAFTVTLSAPTNGYVIFGTGASNTATINDDDTATVSLAKINAAAEPSTHGLFRVTQTAASSTNTVVTYVIGGTATTGSDFTTLSGSVTIPAGQTTADINVPVLDGTLVEATETVVATLNNVTSGDPQITLGAPLSDTVNIIDNDDATVSVAKITDGVETSAPTNALFRVTQTAAASTDTVITYTVGGNATSGTDFTAPSGSVTILAGQTTAEISVAVINENVVEPTETISLTLTGFTARDPEVTLGTTVLAAANITDNDTSAITLAATSANQNEGTGGATTAFTFSATLSNPVQGGFTLAYSIADGTALAASDYIDNDGTLIFTGAAAESKTITVLVNHDDTNEIDETFTVALGSITGTTLGSSLSTAGAPQTGTIRNDDALAISIAATDADADENTAATGTWRVSRNGLLGTTTVQLAIAPSSSARAADWTQSGATFGSLAPGNTGTAVIPDGVNFVDIALAPTADLQAEAAETVRLNVTTDPAYVIGSPSDATITIGQNDYLVTNTNDSGEGTLRQAILNHNFLKGANTVTFSDGTGGTVNFTDATAETINLASELLVSAGPTDILILAGPGPDLLTLQRPSTAGTSFRILNLGGTTTLQISGITIAGGKALEGGGIFNFDGTLTVTNTILSGNTASSVGGGIYNRGSLTVTTTTLSENSTSSGGGIFNDGTLSVINSTFSGNTASSGGGGIYNSGTLTVANSTFSGNTTNAYGGGIREEYGTLTVINSTLTANSAGINGGGIFSLGGSANVKNSIIAGNSAESWPDVRGMFTSSGGNVIGNVRDVTVFTATNDLTGTDASPLDPLLGHLADNGGPTLTHLLFNGSPAINNGLAANLPADVFDLDGDSNTTETLPVDQRGTPNLRTRGPAPDAGAIEAFAFEPTLTATMTNEDAQSTSGLVIMANTADGGFTTHYKITGILNGTLFKNNGTTAIASGSCITKAEGLAGLKFTPATNLNTANTPAGFSFAAQAAVGTSAGNERGSSVPVAITVNAVNDAPTVVLAGLSDQILTIGQNLNVPLSSAFTDIEGDPLAFTVETNSDGSKASAVIFKDSADLTGLASGTTSITVLADDGQGGTVTDTFLVSVGTVNPTPLQIGSTATLNRQNGLFEISVVVTNTTPYPINGFRLHVNYNDYEAAHPSLILFNASSPAAAFDVYYDYPFPVAVDGAVPLTLAFYTNNRRFPSPFQPELSVESLGTTQISGPLGEGIQTTLARLPDRSVRLEFVTVAGKWYRVRYSPDLVNWFTSELPVQATGNLTPWIDKGPPHTNPSPANENRRFYLINEIPAP